MMNAPNSNAIRQSRLLRKVGYGFFLFLIAWSILAASIGVYRTLTYNVEVPATPVGTP